MTLRHLKRLNDVNAPFEMQTSLPTSQSDRDMSTMSLLQCQSVLTNDTKVLSYELADHVALFVVFCGTNLLIPETKELIYAAKMVTTARDGEH